jgi:pSer/pThr/pTyr-binding forkhead associated (FHA) protein
MTMVSTRRSVAPPKAKLLIKPDRVVELSRNGETVIGRDAANAAVVDDRQASRHHARVICRDNDFWIEDLNSTNGTRVNGIRVEKQKLADNDQIGIGDTILTFTVEPV